MKSARTIAVAFLIVLLPMMTAQVTPENEPDALDDTLSLVGLRRADLGWTPKSWWPRFPADIPYKLRAFDGLFAEPLDTVTFTRSLAQTAWDGLDPEALNAEPERGSRSLFRTVQRLGIDPKFGGFRGYTANALAPEMPLDKAIIELYRAAHRTTSPNTFGMELPYPKIEERLAEQVKVLPEGVSPILGQLVLNIIDAHYWAELAFRKVDPADRLKVATNCNVGIEMIDAWDYEPAMDDVAKAWDEASMWYAAQKCVEALDQARMKLQDWQAPRETPTPFFGFLWETPWGWVIVRGGHEDPPSGPPVLDRDPLSTNLIEYDNILLMVDIGERGNSYYTGARSSVSQSISLTLDMGGDDYYEAGRGPAQGAGVCGVGIVMDAAGNDAYHGVRYSQGVGQFGFGLLADLGGNDKYELQYSGQGCGYFGVGLLFDVAGDDEYRIQADGQGLGGVAGVGVLADRTGNDKYIAERKHSVTGRPSYHSPDNDVAVSNVQGCGMGRRGDGADGHSWAGGLGALLDGDGDDYYFAGNWCMGTGYWFGIGVLHDRAGNDEYHGVAYSQGTGAHFCIGALIDEGGDDKHLAEENSHSCIAWAHDFTIGLVVNIGGNDLYSVDTGGLSYSINRSVSMLIDIGGDDVYKTDVKQREEKKHGVRPGFAMNAEGFRARDGVTTYFADTTSLGLFLDIGGNDTYWDDLKNNDHWLDPPDSDNWADRNFSVGVDRPDGTVSFSPRPVRPPTGD